MFVACVIFRLLDNLKSIFLKSNKLYIKRNITINSYTINFYIFLNFLYNIKFHGSIIVAQPICKINILIIEIKTT